MALRGLIVLYGYYVIFLLLSWVIFILQLGSGISRASAHMIVAQEFMDE